MLSLNHYLCLFVQFFWTKKSHEILQNSSCQKVEFFNILKCCFMQRMFSVILLTFIIEILFNSCKWLYISVWCVCFCVLTHLKTCNRCLKMYKNTSFFYHSTIFHNVIINWVLCKFPDFSYYNLFFIHLKRNK